MSRTGTRGFCCAAGALLLGAAILAGCGGGDSPTGPTASDGKTVAQKPAGAPFGPPLTRPVGPPGPHLTKPTDRPPFLTPPGNHGQAPPSNLLARFLSGPGGNAASGFLSFGVMLGAVVGFGRVLRKDIGEE